MLKIAAGVALGIILAAVWARMRGHRDVLVRASVVALVLVAAAWGSLSLVVHYHMAHIARLNSEVATFHTNHPTEAVPESLFYAAHADDALPYGSWAATFGAYMPPDTLGLLAWYHAHGGTYDALGSVVPLDSSAQRDRLMEIAAALKRDDPNIDLMPPDSVVAVWDRARMSHAGRPLTQAEWDSIPCPAGTVKVDEGTTASRCKPR